MFLKFYKLCEQPFGVTPDPNFLYLSRGHREALSSLLYAIETGQGFAAVIANAGMGKTTLLFRLQEVLGDSARTAFVFQTECAAREFLQYITADLGIATPDKSTGALIEQMNQFLLRETNEGRRVVLVIDEAQNLDNQVLETIRMLSNFETPKAKMLQIVLAGQPPLADKLMEPGLIQLRQRVSILVRLCPLEPFEIVEYIDHRLRIAGHNGPSLFSPDALSDISEQSQGIPRNINTICFNALSLGYAKEQKVVSSETIREVVGDLDMSLLAVRSTVHEKTVEEEITPAREAGNALVSLSPRRKDNSTVRSFIRFPTIGRISRWKASAAICTLLLVAYFTAWHPINLQKVDPGTISATPHQVLNPTLFRREGTMTFTVFVKPNDTLADICHSRLGKFDEGIVKEIRRLNPDLSDIDFLLVGQAIQLPLVPGAWKPIEASKRRDVAESPKGGITFESKF